MDFIFDALADGVRYLIEFGPDLRGIIALTLVVSLTATLIGSTIGVPSGLWLGQARLSPIFTNKYRKNHLALDLHCTPNVLVSE